MSEQDVCAYCGADIDGEVLTCCGAPFHEGCYEAHTESHDGDSA